MHIKYCMISPHRSEVFITYFASFFAMTALKGHEDIFYKFSVFLELNFVCDQWCTMTLLSSCIILGMLKTLEQR